MACAPCFISQARLPTQLGPAAKTRAGKASSVLGTDRKYNLAMPIRARTDDPPTDATTLATRGEDMGTMKDRVLLHRIHIDDARQLDLDCRPTDEPGDRMFL